jgi:hypothetical protein
MQRSRCAATNSRGEPCRSTIVLASGYCRGHDPAYAEARRRSAARNGMSARDPELREIREGLKRLMVTADAPGADLARVDVLTRVARARLYAAKIESEIRRHSAESADLESYAEELEDELDAIKKERSL